MHHIAMRNPMAGVLFFLAAPLALAQDVPAVTRTDKEIGAFAGASYGIDKFRGMGGGNFAAAVGSRYFMPYVEFSYFPGIDRERPQDRALFLYNVPLYDFHGGVHLRYPLHERYFVPYAVFGAGVIHSPARTVTAVLPARDGFPELRVPNLAVPSSTNLAVNLGGGIRFYVHRNFGFRAEAKAYKPTGDLPFGAESKVFGKVVGGIFLQFK